MQYMGRTLLVMICAAILSGCGLATDMAEMQKKSDAIALALEKEVGVKPFVGWNIHNGKLTTVNVSFPIEGVSKLAVGDLDAKVRVVVSRSFEKAPEQLVISAISKK